MKLVVLVRTDLHMSVGKIGAQVAHAAVVAVLSAWDSELLRRWLDEGQPKIVLAVRDAGALSDLAAAAQRACLAVHVVYDAGRTQIPAETATCCGIGPAEDADVDAVTGALPLL